MYSFMTDLPVNVFINGLSGIIGDTDQKTVIGVANHKSNFIGPVNFFVILVIRKM